MDDTNVKSAPAGASPAGLQGQCDAVELAYLGTLAELCGATEHAIAALSASALPELREQISQQEALVSRLRQIPVGAGGRLQAIPEVMNLHRRLAMLNRRYAALVAHLSRSAEISLSVCKSCGAGFGQQTPAASSWSCEI